MTVKFFLIAIFLISFQHLDSMNFEYFPSLLMDLSQFTPTNKNETFVLEIVKSLHNVDENKVQNHK